MKKYKRLYIKVQIAEERRNIDSQVLEVIESFTEHLMREQFASCDKLCSAILVSQWTGPLFLAVTTQEVIYLDTSV